MSNIRNKNPFIGHTFALEKGPCWMNCPACGKTTLTEVASEKTTCWHLVLAPILWAFISCFCCCFKKRCTICKNPADINHYCGNCGCFLGRYYKTIEPKKIKEGRTETV